MIGVLELIERMDDETELKTKVICDVESISQSEFNAAGQKDIKPDCRFLIWNHEYGGQTEALYQKEIYTIYRTYIREYDGRIELYAERRLGRR